MSGPLFMLLVAVLFLARGWLRESFIPNTVAGQKAHLTGLTKVLTIRLKKL